MTVAGPARPLAVRPGRAVALVVAAFGCLVTAALFTSSAVDGLRQRSAGAAVGAGSVGAPATRQELAWAVMFGCVGVICAVLTEATLWRRPGLEPGPLGLLRGVGNSRFIGGTLGAVTAYLAVVYLLAGVPAPLITTGQWPQLLPSGPGDPGALGGDLVEAGTAGFIEELSLFAIPVALLGLWKSRHAWWTGLVLVIVLRFGIHLYYGVGFAAIMVVPRPRPRADGVYLHPGGGVLGSASSSDSRLWELAQAVSMAVVSVDYRLAPEHPFPAGAEDCIDVARWLVETSAATFGAATRIVGGESQGAYLAALVLLALREDPATRDGFAGAYLAYGPYDQSLTPSCRAYGDRNLVTSTPAEEWFRAQCYPGLDPEQRRDPAISPLYADLAGLPPARFVVGTNDPLLDDTLFMAARWRAAGSLAELDVVDAACHAFTAFPLTVARREQERFYAFLRERATAARG